MKHPAILESQEIIVGHDKPCPACQSRHLWDELRRAEYEWLQHLTSLARRTSSVVTPLHWYYEVKHDWGVCLRHTSELRTMVERAIINLQEGV